MYGQHLTFQISFCSEKCKYRLAGIGGKFSGLNVPFSGPEKTTDKAYQDVKHLFTYSRNSHINLFSFLQQSIMHDYACCITKSFQSIIDYN